MSRFRHRHAPNSIHFARITAVHPEDYSIDVVTEGMGQILQRIGYAVMYAHHIGGEGTYFIPEEGAWCWLVIPSDHNRPFVIGFSPPFSLVDDHKANRLNLIPGDQAMISRDQNGIIVRRGGITQISATPVCQRTYTPIANTIRDICENYELNTASGRLQWSVRRGTPDEKSQSPSVLVLEAREFAQVDPVIFLRIGSVETPDSASSSGPRISAGRKVYLDVEVPGVFRYRINLDGESLMVQSGRRSLRVEGDEIHFVDQDRELTIFGNETRIVKGSSTRKYASEDVQVQGTSKERAARKEIFASQVILGSADAVPAILGPALLTWLASHVHGPAGTPPVKPPLPATLLAKKVKLK